MPIKLFFAFLLILFFAFSSGLILNTINQLVHQKSIDRLGLIKGSFGPSSILTGWVFLTGIIAMVLTKGYTIFLIINAGIILYTLLIPPSKNERYGSINKIAFNSFFLAISSFLAFYLFSSRLMDLQLIDYYHDKYFYSQVGISLIQTGIETTNTGAAFAGFQGNYLPYHYLELWSAGFSGIGLKIPVLLMLQYVFPALAIFLSISFLQTTLCETKAYNHYGLWIFISLTCLTLFPKLPIHSEYFAENSLLTGNTKLLFIVVFLSGIIYSINSKKSQKMYLFLFLAGLTYFTALPGVLLTIGLLLMYEFIGKEAGLSNFSEKLKALKVPLLLFLLASSYLGYLYWQMKAGAVHIYTGVDKGFPILESLSNGLYQTVLYHIRPVFSRYILSVVCVLLILIKLRNQRLSIFLIGMLLGSLITSSAFYRVLDGDQFMTNTMYSLLLTFTIFSPLILKKVPQFLLATTLLVYSFFYFSFTPQSTIKNASSIECLKNSDKRFIGTYNQLALYENHYLANTSINSIGNFIMNYRNIIPVDLNDFDRIIEDGEFNDLVKNRLSLNFVSQYLKNSDSHKDIQSFITDEIDEIILPKGKIGLDTSDFDKDCEDAEIDVWIRQQP